MKAFVEWLYRPLGDMHGAVGILRVGPRAETFGDPYDGSITFRIENGYVDCKGGKTGSRLTKSHVIAGVREIKRVTGLDTKWTHNGKERLMTTTLNNDPHGSDGKLDRAKVKHAANEMFKAFDKGTETLIDISRVDLPDGTHQTIIHHKAP